MHNTGSKMRIRAGWALAVWLILVILVSAGGLPALEANSAASNFGGAVLLAVDRENRADVVRFYETVYQASRGVDSMWKGDIANCDPGTNNLEYAEATLLRVNYFRAMAGLPADVRLNQEWSGGCQAAALACGAANRVAHVITSDWPCYTPAAAQAAATSNLLLGDRGPTAVDTYMDDPGPENGPVGHRRWLMYPPQRWMGTASIPSVAPHYGVNVLRVVGGHGPRPVSPEWVAWPPSGHVPYQILPRRSNRWSFSMPNADFSQADVTMMRGETAVAISIEAPYNDRGMADNTVVWLPEGVSIRAPTRDVRYTVRIAGVVVAGATRAFHYEVVIINPEVIHLAVERVSDQEIRLSWTADAVLQRSQNPSGEWEDTSATSPHRVSLQPSTAFFQLRAN